MYLKKLWFKVFPNNFMYLPTETERASSLYIKFHYPTMWLLLSCYNDTTINCILLKVPSLNNMNSYKVYIHIYWIACFSSGIVHFSPLYVILFGVIYEGTLSPVKNRTLPWKQAQVLSCQLKRSKLSSEKF